MDGIKTPPKILNPLGLIFVFFSFTETILGFALFKTEGNIQVALTTFVIGFPLLVTIAFFVFLWWRPENLYSPRDYGNDDSFMRIISESRSLRGAPKEDALVLESIITEKIRAELTSEETIKRLSSQNKGEVSDVLLNVANNISSRIKKDAFFTVSYKGISGQLDDAVLPISAFSNFGELTDHLYFEISEHVEPYTYGYSWIVRDSKSKKSISSVRVMLRKGKGTYVVDDRKLEEVGIKAGSKIEVTRL